MNYMNRFAFPSLIFSIFFLLFLSGCIGSSTHELSPEEIISQTADRMETLSGFEFLIELSGAPAFLDNNMMISFRRAEGQYNSPDKVDATVRVIGLGLVTDVQIISVGGTQWETNFLTGEWQLSDPQYSFNPSLLFDPETGIRAVLVNDLSNLELVGFEELVEVPGISLYFITATVDGERLYSLTFGMIDADTLNVRLYIDPDSFDLHRIVMVDTAVEVDSEDTIWQMDFWSFNEIFDIEPPIKIENTP